MLKANGQLSKWVQTEVAKHTPDSIWQRIVDEQKQIHPLASVGLGPEMERARATHCELIQVLSERLARAAKQSP